MGKSDKPTSFDDYTYDRHALWTTQLFRHVDSTLNLGSVFILGHDYGTPIGIRMMSEHFPNRFAGFRDVNSSLPDGTYISPTHYNWRQFVRDNPDVPVGNVVSANVNPPLTQCEINSYNAPYLDSTYKMAVRIFPEMVPEDTTWSEAIANNAAWKFMETYNMPFMTIFGAFDGVGIPSARMDFINRVPGAYGQPHPQLNVLHYAPEDNPVAVSEQAIQFLDDIYHKHTFQTLLSDKFNTGLDDFVDGGSFCNWDSAVRSY